MIVELAPAKINLALHIRRKRPDGYHDLETLFAFAGKGDAVTLSPADRWSFTVAGPFADALDASATPASAGAHPRLAGDGAAAFTGVNNLVTRAANAFTHLVGDARPHAISLDKHLPVASGIGGGSADAAATLRALARCHAIDPLDPRLFAIAAGLGADVPACLLGRTALGTGRGDDLVPLDPLGDLPLLLVNPRVGVSTATMFAAWDGIDHGPIATDGPILTRARQGRNDFTALAIAHAPAIAEVLAKLEEAPGCTLARMSGSGATCFGIFADGASRDGAAEQARAHGWWTLATTVM